MVLALGGVVVWLWGGSLAERGAALLIGASSVVFWLPVRDVAQHFGFGGAAGAMGDSGAPLPSSWLEVIAESRSLWSDPLSRTVGDLTVGVLLVPIALLLWGLQALRPARSPMLWVPITATTVVLAMALTQKRYIYYLAPLVAIAAGDLVNRAARRTRSPLAVTTVALALLLAPSWSRFLALGDTGPAGGLDVIATLERLAALDPPPIDPLVAARGPAGEVEGILAPWSLGHFVTLYAQRPAVSDNFGYGFLRQADVYSAPAADDARVAALLRDWRCRYVVTGDLRPVLRTYARGAGRDLPVEQMWSERVHRSTSERPLPYLKLVLTSETGLPDGDRIVPLLKVFAVVDPTLPGSAPHSRP
jgi:asparagine N-glycosylation enzyme membrane subunit Stt3